MIIYMVNGNIFNSPTKNIINPVNIAGVMEAGLALQFKNKFPNNYKTYKNFCDSGKFNIGNLLAVKENGYTIINFPTKKHWKDKSELEYIKSGLETLTKLIHKMKLLDIAIPPLGCSLGGLNWKDVRELIEDFSLTVPSTTIYLFKP